MDQCWNMEVGPAYEDPGFTWPRADAREAATLPRATMWYDQGVDEVRVFHFSGTKLYPWWYVNFSPDEAYDQAASKWWHRDPRRLVASAIWEWRIAFDEVAETCTGWRPQEKAAAEAAMQRLRDSAAEHLRREKQDSERQQNCRHCRNWFLSTEGRWLLGWEGWWLCTDCVVGYVFGDEEPEAPCSACASARRGRWVWVDGCPFWHCYSCADKCPVAAPPDATEPPETARRRRVGRGGSRCGQRTDAA